jgi:hypothetical protein
MPPPVEAGSTGQREPPIERHKESFGDSSLDVTTATARGIG